MQYKIIDTRIIPCRVIDMKLCTNKKDYSQFIVAYIGEYNSGKFLCSVRLNYETNDSILMAIRNNTRYNIYRYTIQLDVKMYHLITWDDVYTGKHKKEHLGEVERNTEGIPLTYSQIVIYANIGNSQNPNMNKVLSNEYIPINSPNANIALTFNNMESYKEKMRLQHEEENVVITDADYDLYEEHRYDSLYMTEEEKIMDALENGDAEIYGF